MRILSIGINYNYDNIFLLQNYKPAIYLHIIYIVQNIHYLIFLRITNSKVVFSFTFLILMFHYKVNVRTFTFKINFSFNFKCPQKND